MDDLLEKMDARRAAVTLGDVPKELYDLVADAMDIVAPTLGPRLPSEVAAMVMGIIAMHIVGDIRAIDELVEG